MKALAVTMESLTDTSDNKLHYKLEQGVRVYCNRNGTFSFGPVVPGENHIAYNDATHSYYLHDQTVEGTSDNDPNQCATIHTHSVGSPPSQPDSALAAWGHYYGIVSTMAGFYIAPPPADADPNNLYPLYKYAKPQQ